MVVCLAVSRIRSIPSSAQAVEEITADATAIDDALRQEALGCLLVVSYPTTTRTDTTSSLSDREKALVADLYIR